MSKKVDPKERSKKIRWNVEQLTEAFYINVERVFGASLVERRAVKSEHLITLVSALRVLNENTGTWAIAELQRRRKQRSKERQARGRASQAAFRAVIREDIETVYYSIRHISKALITDNIPRERRIPIMAEHLAAIGKERKEDRRDRGRNTEAA